MKIHQGTFRAAALSVLLLTSGSSAQQDDPDREQFPKNYSEPLFSRDCVGREDDNLFVLTFDDGPTNTTEAVLDVLKEKGVPATFFMTCENFEVEEELEAREALVRRMIEDGHLLANHGMTHQEFLVEEVEQCHSIVENITDGYQMEFFRPASGLYTIPNYEALVERDYRFSMWNFDTLDWMEDRDPEDVLDQVRTAVTSPTTPSTAPQDKDFPRRGSFVMLAHDTYPTMLKPVGNQTLLGALIDIVLDANYEIVGLDDCLRVASVPTSAAATPLWGLAQVLFVSSVFIISVAFIFA
jgi:peptidoglycan/xylan/chitin deacetylase (PgdA/CDA1 family)